MSIEVNQVEHNNNTISLPSARQKGFFQKFRHQTDFCRFLPIVATSKYHEILENSTPDKIPSSPPIFLEEVLDVQTNIIELKEELLLLGHEILNISNIRHNKILQPSSLFFIELKQKHNNKEIYQVKTLLNSIIQREPPYKKKKLSNVKDAILHIGHYPKQWKMSHIIVIDKPGKPPHEILSYHPISLLPIFSKIFEKLLLKGIESILKETNLIPDHQFGFRKQHSTIQQIHRLVDHIRKDLEDKRYCSAIFFDIKQAFDKVWHSGIFYKKIRYSPIH
uniref:Pre-C2HC domain-containing protein n=1 Tax=Vespula pensylvanica TaxID=30213 RepID=A0A834K4E9_VESPE|nr:hypothetical protein H0235_015976 [Vespula pensylvanica]